MIAENIKCNSSDDRMTWKNSLYRPFDTIASKHFAVNEQTNKQTNNAYFMPTQYQHRHKNT